MRIERLEVSGLRSHRGNPPTVLDLADNRLVAIVGPTGAGKSSLLEAVCFALFGEATFGGKAYKELSTDGRTEISVRMLFRVGDDRYQLVRTVAPNQKGVFGAKETWLRQIDADERTLTHKDQVRKVDAAIRTLLGGMDREQFCQAVLLAQNRFAELLEADERKRNELLDILLGLTALEEARKATLATQKSVQRNLERLDDKRKALPPDPAAYARDTKKQAKAMKDLARQAEEGATNLGTLAAKAGDLTNAARELEGAAALRVADSDGRKLLTKITDDLESLAREDERLTREINVAKEARGKASERLSAAKSALDSVEKVLGKVGTHDVVATRLGELQSLYADRPNQVSALGACEVDLTTVSEELSLTEGVLAGLSNALETAKRAEASALAKVAESERAMERRGEAIAAAKTTAARLLTCASTMARTVTDLADVHGAVETNRGALDIAKAEDEECGAVLKAAQKAHAAAAASHDCKPGDACPVCDRDLPPGWSPPDDRDLEKASQGAAKARATAATAAAALGKTYESWVRHVDALRSAASTFGGDLKELATLCTEKDLPPPPAHELELAENPALAAATELAESIQGCTPVIETWRDGLDALVIPLNTAAQVTLGDAKAATQTRGDTDTRMNEVQDKVSTLTQTKGVLEERQRSLTTAMDGINRQLTRLLGQVPSRLGDLVDKNAALPTERAQRTLHDDKATVDAAERERANAEGALQEAEGCLATLSTEKMKTVDTPRAGRAATLVTLAAAVMELADLVKVKKPDPMDPDGAPAALLEAARELGVTAGLAATTAAAEVDLIREEASTLLEPARVLVAKLVALKAEADPQGLRIAASPDSEAAFHPDTLSAVQQLVGAAKTAASRAEAEANEAETNVAAAKELDKRIVGLDGWRANLSGAIEVLKKDRFPSWARNERITELVQSASDLLSQMTGGRYRFDHHLRISDEVAGIVRSATTLSGGEKFEAALALALSVAEIAGRSGIRFDTLFLDEGFAGLDQANLGRALDALEAQVEAGRCIVVITHIGAVADRIKDVLYIEPDGMGGSKVRWLNEEERYELGADLDLVEATTE